MAQFRTTADILDEVLQKSGEPTNGNSPYESIVLTYLNKAHQAIIGGGSIFSLKVDEPWTWARAKNPMVLEFQPAITYGTISVTENDINVTFNSAPAVSVQGWYLQLVGGEQTIYRITQHSAGVSSATLDSNCFDATGDYSFRVFKLDYELTPAFIYVDSQNDRLDLVEVGSTQITVSLTHGSYTPSTFISHVVARLNASGTNGLYTGSYDSVLKQFTLTSSLAGGKLFSLLGATGTNRRRSALPLLGLDLIDHTAANDDSAGTFISDYLINGISRLIEPFRIFTSETECPTITGNDPILMAQDYPIHLCDERTPSQFAKVKEDGEGTITIRLNSYPKEKLKALIDWIPIPIDLQDNTASYPLVPRKDIDVLIHAACAMVLFDKEDSKWEIMLKLAGAGLEAMEKKNRSEAFRIGDSYAQIVPRLDLANKPRKLRYGYTVQGGSTPASVSETATSMIKVTLPYTDFQVGSTTKTVTARTLPANRTLFGLIIKHSIAFSGGSISALTVSVGITGEADRFISSFDIFQAVGTAAQDAVLLLYYPAVATNITVTATAVGANLSALTAGSLDIWFQETITE